MTSGKSELLLLIGIALAALAAGAASGDTGIAAAVAFGLYAARQVWIVRRLALVLRRKQRLEPPFPGGRWGEIFQAVRSLQLRSRKRKRRLTRFVARFRDAAAALPDAVVILGRGNHIEWCNPAAGTLLGLAEREFVGVPITVYIRDRVFVDYLAAGDYVRPLRLPAPGERSVMLSILITPFGRRRQKILVCRDITRAYHLDQTRKDFVANVSHELRTPLTVLSGNLELLDEQGVAATESRDVIASMRANVDRMRDLVGDLLTLSRLEMERLEQRDEAVDVPALLESIQRDARTLAAGSRHVLRLDAEPGLCLRGSGSALRSAFANLVNNAVRHTPPRTRIEVRWSGTGTGARLDVRDNGPGIAARHLPRLTERFYRIDSSRSTDTGGTGLGLAIVKHVLEQHDATLAVESREGEGTTFVCRFPQTRIAMPADGPSAAMEVRDLHGAQPGARPERSDTLKSRS